MAEQNQSQGMDMLASLAWKEMSTESIEGLKAQFAGNESLVKLLDGILAIRKADAMKAQALTDWQGAIEAMIVPTTLFSKASKDGKPVLVGLPTPPDGIHNVYFAWTEVEVPQGEPVEVEMAGVKSMRQPMVKAWKWIAKVNAGFSEKSASHVTITTPKSTKRAIRVYKRVGTTLEPIGNYANATRACEALKLTIGGDSANRVLAREGYITEAYEGTDIN